jgi:hypothetical protein
MESPTETPLVIFCARGQVRDFCVLLWLFVQG